MIVTAVVPFLITLLAADATAAVTLSNGERVDGRLRFPEGRKLEVLVPALSRRVAIEPGEVARIVATVDEESIEQGWMFKEEGNHDKVKLPARYPVRTLTTEVTLLSGETVRGRVVTSFGVENALGEERTLAFVAHQRGEAGQTLVGLVYVKELVVRGAAPPPPPTRGSIGATAPAAIAGVERELALEAPFAGLGADRYDVFLFRGARVRYGLTGEPLAAADVAAVASHLRGLDDFYTRKRVVAAARVGKTVRAFLELARPEASHEPEWRHARWELWLLEPVRDGFDVRRRLFLRRERYPAAKGIPAFEYTAESGLAGVRPGATVEEKRP